MTRWDQARQLFRLGRRPSGPGAPANSLHDPRHAPRPADPRAAMIASDDSRPRARSICVASGKGGTGKSSVSASLAALLARRGKTLLLDADLGCANAHILQGARPAKSFADVIGGDASLEDIVTPCKNGVDLLAGGSGYASLAGLKSFEIEMIGLGLQRLEPDYEHLVVDSAAGLSRQTVAFATACDATLLVTTPDVTAMTDAYAFLKVFVRQCEALGVSRPLPSVVVNRVSSPTEATEVARRLQDVVAKFLGERVEFLIGLPDDRAAFRCAQRREPVGDGEPDSELSRALVTLSGSVLRRIDERLRHADGAGRRREAAGERLAKAASPVRRI